MPRGAYLPHLAFFTFLARSRFSRFFEFFAFYPYIVLLGLPGPLGLIAKVGIGWESRNNP